MVIKKADELREITIKVIMRAGADERNANRLTEALISSNLCGVDTHGVFMLPFYVDSIKAGELDPRAWPEIIKETPNSALVKGNWAFGHVTAKYAMEVAIEKVKENGMSIVGGVQVMHTGRLGEYVEMAAKENIISMMWTGGYGEEKPAAVPYGGAKTVLHTNPFSMGFPAGSEPPMISDFATSVVSGVKVIFARDKKEQLPQGCIVDKEGKPTCDPNDFYNGGGHIPFGGYKGYALMLANEFLGRIFVGSDLFIEENRKHPVLRHSGFTIIAFKSDLFNSFEDYSSRMDEIENRIRAVPPAPGFKEVLIPGDLERRTREERIKNGIPIPDNIWESIIQSAKSLGIDKV